MGTKWRRIAASTSAARLGHLLYRTGLLVPAQGVPHDEVPDASTTTRIVQQVGGSFGTAVLAMILMRHLASLGAVDAASRGAAFDVAFWWAIGFGVLALLPALVIPKSARAPVPSASSTKLTVREAS